MLELGQPIHGYDLDKLAGGITVRRASAGREARDARRQGARRSHAEDLLITDESGPIGLAGVMGGGTTEMSDATRATCSSRPRRSTRCRSPAPRAGTSCPSEASARFERGVDPAIPFVAARSAPPT